jgi:AAA domain/Bifunctional DNA primase/polymerase, N-terminal
MHAPYTIRPPGTQAGSPLMTPRQFWDLAIARGLFPVCCRGKVPIGEGWNTWPSPIWHPAADSIGLRCGGADGLTAFDVDKNDPATALALLGAFRDVLGPDIPVRWGNRPRFTIPFYFTDTPVRGRTFQFPDGDKLQIISGQFVAFGPHEKTGIPYAWENWAVEWPRITQAQFQSILAQVPMRAGTSLKFHADYEICDASELEQAIPRTREEWQTGRDACMHYAGLLKQELLGLHNGRGSEIFRYVGILKFAVLHGMYSREEIENTIIEAGHGLDEKVGGRTLGEEINRQKLLPVLRGNLVMTRIVGRRTVIDALHEAQQNPAAEYLTGLELSPDDNENDLPWLIYRRVLRGEVHLFSGHSGAGKSAVVSDGMAHYLAGRSWLDAEIETLNGHVLYIAAEDGYSTKIRMRHILRQEPNGPELMKRFHVMDGLGGVPMALEAQCVATAQAMTAGNKRLDIIVLDTFGASGLCFADNDTEAVLKAMHMLKQIAVKTNTALIILDHLPLGKADAWQKGNGAKSQNSGFVYRITLSDDSDEISIDCGKARGAPKAISYTGHVVSENYGTDRKGRISTINVFKREFRQGTQQSEVTAVMQLAAMLPGAMARGMDALRGGAIVLFDGIDAELGSSVVGGEMPKYAINKASAFNMFQKNGMNALLNSGYLRPMRGVPYYAIYPPTGIPTGQIGGFPWTK